MGYGPALVAAAGVVGEHRRILGIVGEQDVVRWLGGRDQPVQAVMSSPVRTIRVDDHLYEAIGCMRRHRRRHLPVVDEQGDLVGMLELHAALEVAVGPLVDDIDRLTHEDSLVGVAEVKTAQVQLAERLLEGGVPAPEIQALLSDINNDIHRRVLRLLVTELVAEGKGSPPVAFACIVMGSGSRGESLLFPDQDHGFILADYPDEQHGEIDPWFIELASRLSAALDRLHFPLCDGGVMATNPVWRKTLSQWRRQVELWMGGRMAAALLFCEIFFDFRGVYGSRALADELRAFATDAASHNHGFLRLMLGLQAEHRAGIGLFGRLLTERTPDGRRGEVDLKLHGTLLLAEGLRLLAMASGIGLTGTLARLDALQAAAVLSEDDADHLRAAFSLLTGLQLRQQIADYRAGTPVGSFVDPKALTERELGLLKQSLSAINDFRARIRADLTGSLL